MASGTPFTEIKITDEVSAKYENMRRSLRSKDQSVGFPKTTAAIKGLEQSIEQLNRSFVRFLGLSGITSLLGAGLIGGIVRATNAMQQFAQSGLQLHYTAKEIGITAERLRYLTDAGRVLGMSQEEARSGVVNLARAMENLRTEGTKAKEFKELAQGRGGEELARNLIRIVNGPDGINRAMEYLAQRTRTMDQRAQTSIKNIFSQPSVAWAEAFNLPGLHKMTEAQIEDLKAYNLAWVNLDRTWFNTKATLGQAVIPAFTSLLQTVTQYLNGPGRGLVKQFADWMRSIKPDDVRAFAQAIGKGIDLFIAGVKKLWPLIQSIDKFVTENLGGWTNVLVGLVAVKFVPGFLLPFGRALKTIGGLMWVVAGIAGLAAVAAPSAAEGAGGDKGGGAGPGSGSGAGTKGGGVEQLPEIEVTPQDNVPLPRSRPTGRRSDIGGRIQLAGLGIPSGITLPDEEGNFPARSSASGGGGTVRQEIASLRQDREVTKDLAETVESATKKVAGLNAALANLPLTDDTGAGRIAAIAGAFRGVPAGAGRGTSPYGGGGGGGGRTPSRSGGGGGRGPRPPTSGPQPQSPPTTSDPGFRPANDTTGRIEGGRLPTRQELADKSIPAGERFNNPFNMWHDRYATQQGGVPGIQITPFDTPAIFPSKMAGAAAAIRKMAESPLYSGKTMWDLIAQWVGHGTSYAPIIAKAIGVPVTTRITPEFLRSEKGLEFLKTMARYETKWERAYPLTDEQWRAARDAAFKRPATNQQQPPAQQNQPGANQNQPTAAPGQGPQPSDQQSRPGLIQYQDFPSFRTRNNREVENFVGFQRAVENMSPEFRGRISAMMRGMPEDVRRDFIINEGWRTYRYQDYLRRAGRYAAPPGHSRHEIGEAIDVDDVGRVRWWIRNYGWKYGIEGIRGDAPHFQLSRRYRGPSFAGQDPGARPREVDPKIHNVIWTNMPDDGSAPPGRFRAGQTRHDVQLKINIRGRRGARVSSRAENLGMTINREMDPTGGGRIESPA